ncbi:hypothetical protein CC80DRAFT_504777 [Byssothecium circinans]|uniref:F-box domain-containing protein n=1 Tax=Byssothecium circinans TaxID=147558 RepID=A0A6A5TTB9_9PLEO|nr:hypothetical protein CC80DRAFT_504777 [Byssothecium circinans]
MRTPEEIINHQTKASKARLHKLLSRQKCRPQIAPPSQRHSAALVQRNRQSPNTFNFFGLPVELRLAVYFHRLVSDDRLIITHRGPRRAQKQQKKIDIGILLACRCCRDEGVQVLYGENIFDFEGITNRGISTAAPFLSIIGPLNASLIRIVIAEHSAAAEELYPLFDDSRPTRIRLGTRRLCPSTHHHNNSDLVSKQENGTYCLTVDYVHTFLSAYGINLSNLRIFAISLLPYGNDLANMDLLRELRRVTSFNIMNTPRIRVQWQDERNQGLEDLVRVICERERLREGSKELGWLEKVNFDDLRRIGLGFHWSTLLGVREWMVWRSATSGKDDV